MYFSKQARFAAASALLLGWFGWTEAFYTWNDVPTTDSQKNWWWCEL